MPQTIAGTFRMAETLSPLTPGKAGRGALQAPLGAAASLFAETARLSSGRGTPLASLGTKKGASGQGTTSHRAPHKQTDQPPSAANRWQAKHPTTKPQLTSVDAERYLVCWRTRAQTIRRRCIKKQRRNSPQECVKTAHVESPQRAYSQSRHTSSDTFRGSLPSGQGQASDGRGASEIKWPSLGTSKHC